jgi:hypothetical protein
MKHVVVDLLTNDLVSALKVPHPWFIDEISKSEGTYHISLERHPLPYLCPNCGVESPVYDRRKKIWRHTNVLNMQVILQATLPRVSCASCDNIRLIDVVWARKGAHNTIMFELWVMRALKCQSLNMEKLARNIGGIYRNNISNISRHYDPLLDRNEGFKKEFSNLWIDSQTFIPIDPCSILSSNIVEKLLSFSYRNY